MLPSPPLGNPPIAKTPDKVEIYPKKRGGEEDAPLGLFTLSGREGVILQTTAENKRIEKKRISTDPKNLYHLFKPRGMPDLVIIAGTNMKNAGKK